MAPRRALGAGKINPALVGELFGSLVGAKGLVLAVSGGPDSMALLRMIVDWRAHTPNPPPVFACTFDHGLRPESAHESAQVQAWCAALGVPHETWTWPPPHPTRRLQERARDVRYQALADFAMAKGADTVLTAHHADDQAETVLLRLARGSGLAGLAGMAAARPLASGITLARPLLGLRKQALVNLCHTLGQGFVEDPSNTNRAFARVRMRQMAEALAREGLDTDGLVRLAARARRAEVALAAATDTLQETIAAAGHVKALAHAPAELVVRVVLRHIAAISGAEPRLERVEVFATRLQASVVQGQGLRANLGGCLFRLDTEGHLKVAPEPSRRRH